MKKTETEKTSYGGFERFLFFVTPILFTVILLGVLLTLFNYNIKDAMKEVGNKIPIVKGFIPDAATSLGDEQYNSANGGETNPSSVELNKKVAELNDTIHSQEEQLLTAKSGTTQKDQQIKELEAKVAELEERVKNRAINQANYTKKVSDLANTYANMMPSKAAPIIENLTLSEQVLLLNAMTEDARINILQKMDAKKAADASILLKDVVPATDRQIAALQERLNLYETNAASKKTVSSTDLANTFAAMTAKNAAALLLQMTSIDQQNVLSILGAMDNASRSRVIGAMSDQDNVKTAQLSDALSN